MTWREDKLNASIDGIEFFYRTWNTKPGRITALHKFYGGGHWVEDIGLAPYELNADIWLAGDDYNRVREQLRELFDTAGPYELIDPLRGAVMVRLLAPPQLTETVKALGSVKIGSLQLVEAGDSAPLIFAATPGKPVELAAIVFPVLAENTTFSIQGIEPGAPAGTGTFGNNGILQSIQAGLNKAASALKKINGKIDGQLGKITSTASAIDRFVDEINTLLNSPQALMSALNALVLAATGFIKLFQKDVNADVAEPAFPVIDTATSVVNDLLAFESIPPEMPNIPDGPQRAILNDAHAQIGFHVKAAGVAAASDMVTGLPFESAAQVVAMNAQIVAGFDVVMGEPTLHPETYEAFAALKSATVLFMLDRQAQLPQLETVVLARTQPALVLAWHLHGDPTRAVDLVRRNRVPHPGFLPAKVPLEVLDA